VSAVLAVVLLVLVLAAWLGAAGFARLRAPLDRLHCVTFVNAGCGLPLIVAACVRDGLSDRTGKIVLAVTISLFSGAATAHAIGRALRVRGSAPETE